MCGVKLRKLSNDDRVEVDQKEPVRNANRGGCGRINSSDGL